MLESIDQRRLVNARENVKIIDFGKRQRGNIKTRDEIIGESDLILNELKEFFGAYVNLEDFAITLSEIAEEYGFENIKDRMIDFFGMLKQRQIDNKIYDDMKVRSKAFARENGCDDDDLYDFYVSLDEYMEYVEDDEEDGEDDPRDDIDPSLLEKYKEAIQEVERINNKVSLFKD